MTGPRPRTIGFAVAGPIARADVPGLCNRIGTSLEESDADLVLCDLGALVDPDAVTIDALARLQLTARRLGRRVLLQHATGELRELVSFMGLADVLRVEPGRQAEEREQRLRVQEEAELDDLTC